MNRLYTVYFDSGSSCCVNACGLFDALHEGEFLFPELGFPVDAEIYDPTYE